MRARARDRPKLLLDDLPSGAPLPVRRGSLRIAAFAAAASLLVYLPCLPHCIPGRRAGELLAAAALGGISRPPSYPLWTQSCGLFLSLAPGSISPVFRGALLSAICGALAAGLLVLWLRQLDLGRRAALIAGLLFAFSAPVWRQSVLPSPDSLDLLLALALLVVLHQWLATRKPLWIYLFLLAAGLGLSDHLAFLGVLVPATALILRNRPPSFRRVPASILAAAALGAGLIPLFAVWLQGDTGTYLHGEDGAGIAGLLHLIADAEPGTATYAARITQAARIITGEWLFLALPLAALGVRAMVRRRRATALLAGTIAAAQILMLTFWGGAADGETIGARSLILLAMVVAPAGYTVDGILQRFGNGAEVRARAVTAASAILPILPLAAHLSADDYSHYRYCDDLSRALVDPLPQGAIVFTLGGYQGPPLIYHLIVEGERPDILHADPCGVPDWDRLPLAASGPYETGAPADTAAALRLLLGEGHPYVFATHPVDLGEGYAWRRWGLLQQVTRRGAGAVPDDDPWGHIRFHDLPADPHPGAHLGRRGAPMDVTARRIAADFYEARADHSIATGNRERAARLRSVAEDLRGAQGGNDAPVDPVARGK